MSYLILKHLTNSELPTEWAKHLSSGQTFTVMIVPEKPVLQPVLSEETVLKPQSFLNHRQEEPVSQGGGYAYLHLKENFFDPS